MTYQHNQNAVNFKRSRHSENSWIARHLKFQEEWKKRDKKFDLDDLEALEKQQSEELGR